MSFSCWETPVINSGTADVLGRACGVFFWLLAALWRCIRWFRMGLGFLGCSAWHKAWRHWPACLDEVSGLKLVGSPFTSDLDTLEFPLLQKWIILIHIQLKAWFSLRECWALQGAAVAKGRVLAWGLLPLGGSDWVSVAFKQMSY